MYSKYKVGDVVHCKREETESLIGFDFVGKILNTDGAQENEEYVVSNAPIGLFGFPILIWEEEIVGYA